jgi:colanic acid/amylovoran biosynthesis glycosyltransferase
VLTVDDQRPRRMVIGYLTNVYPKQSHSFIRREIAAVEALGHEVRRYSIRHSGTLVDAADLAELERTAVLLQAGAIAIALSVAVALRRPGAFVSALGLAISVGRRSTPGALRYLAYFVEACLLLRWCRRDGVEHLHAHFGSNPAGVAMLCRALGGPTYSFTAHGIETFDAPEFQALDEKIGRAAFVAGVSQFGRSQLCRWSDPAHWERIHVIRCGVDQQILGRTPEPVPAAPRLVCVARLNPEKGHLPLLQAALALHRSGRDFELALVGDGPMRAQLEALTQRLGLARHVRFTGWLDGDGVIREILASRTMVLPSFSEGLPVVLMEALALGRPCIATQITGIPELVQPGVSGWLVPASDVEALAAAMAAALDATPDALQRLAVAGAERVRTHHDASQEAARMVALFSGSIGSAVPARAQTRRRKPVGSAEYELRAPREEHRRVGAAGGALRALGARAWRTAGLVERNRQDLYGGAAGLRIAVFHGTPPRTLEQVKQVVEWWLGRWPMATPGDVDDLVDGRWRAGAADRLLVTFDDGLSSNYAAAVWLARAGIQATFFVIPTLIDRTVAEFVRHHDERGVRAFPPAPSGDAQGLSSSQVREILAMGHRVGAHNNAHRDLGQIHSPTELRYEIGDAIERVGELTGAACHDFAIGFGQPENITTAAIDYLQERCPNVYMCYRGLNVPGRTPRFLLRHAHDPGHPTAFTRLCLEGGADHWLADRIRTMERCVGLLPIGAPLAAPLGVAPAVAIAPGAST